MKKGLKHLSIACAFILSFVVAVFAGMFLATWDTGNIQTVYAMMRPAEKAPEEKVQQIKKKDESIKNAVGNVIDKGATVSGFSPIFLPDSPLTKEEDEPEEIAADIKETASEKTNKGKKPIEITAEISGIKEIVRAGDSDETVIVNNRIDEYKNKEKPQDNGLTLDPVESYPLPYTTVDKSYFEDALFIGDSRMQGFGMYSKVNATFYAATAFQLYQYKTFKVVQTPEGKVPIFDAMPYDKFTKIYIKVGLNEFGISDASLVDYYTQFINDLRIMQPRAIIYIHAILPVTASKSQTDRVHSNENIARRNEVLKNFAEVMKCYFVDVGPYVSDATGALIEDSAADGIHMSGKYMPEWVEGLCKQAVIWPQ